MRHFVLLPIGLATLNGWDLATHIIHGLTPKPPVNNISSSEIVWTSMPKLNVPTQRKTGPERQDFVVDTKPILCGLN